MAFTSVFLFPFTLRIVLVILAPLFILSYHLAIFLNVPVGV